MTDIVKISIWVPDQEALKKILDTAHVHPECGSPRRDESGQFIVTLYTTKAEAQKIKTLPYRQQMDEQYGKTLEARQKEVSQTDRFQGGKIKPTGLGTKK